MACRPYAQYDNDLRFHGPHHHPNSLGSVALFCLALDVIPVFAPPREHGIQNQIESFNDLRQIKVWQRFLHQTRLQLRRRSDAFVQAHHRKTQERQSLAPTHHSLPPPLLANRADPIIIFLRPTYDHGAVALLGDRFQLDPFWKQRLVMCEVFLHSQKILFFGLRRSQPSCEPLLASLKITTATTRFERYLHAIVDANLNYANCP